MKLLLSVLLMLPLVAKAYVSEEGKDDPIKKEGPTQQTQKKDPDADFQKATEAYKKQLKEYEDRHPEMYRGKNQNKK